MLNINSPVETDISILKQVFETNFFGVIEVTETFIDLLRQSPEPRIVNLTSDRGERPPSCSQMTTVG